MIREKLGYNHRIIIWFILLLGYGVLFSQYNILMKVGVICILSGGFLNLLCMGFNKKKMPVFEGEDTEIHLGFLNKRKVKLWFLSDIFDLRYYVFSIGDFIQTCGIIMVIIGMIALF